MLHLTPHTKNNKCYKNSYILFILHCFTVLCFFLSTTVFTAGAYAASQAPLPLAPTSSGHARPIPPQSGAPTATPAQKSTAGSIIRNLTQQQNSTAQQNQAQLARIMAIEGDPLAPLFQEGAPQEQQGGLLPPMQAPAVITPQQTVPTAPTQTEQAATTAKPLEDNTIYIVIRPFNSIVVTSPFTGKVLRLMVHDGDVVTKGQEIIRFEQNSLQADLAAAQATLKRLTTDLTEKAPSTPLEQQLVAEKIQLATDDITHIEDRMALAAVKAPFAGRITDVFANTSQVYPTGAPLIEIAEAGLLSIECTAPSKFMRWLLPGTQLQVYVAETGQVYNAKVRRIGGKVNSETKTIKVYASFTREPANLLPGMTGMAKIVQSAPQQ